MTDCLELLAQLPTTYVFINPFKLVAFVLVFTVWTMFAQWVDKDTIAVNTYRILWNMIVLGVGAAAVAIGLLVPMFVVGFLLFLVANLVLMIVYIVHRNKLVAETDRVLTREHFRRIREEGLTGKKKKKTIEVKERVRLTGADHEVVAIPEGDIEREQYRVAQDLLFEALWRRAASIEVSPAGQEVAKVAFVIDGVPTERDSVPRQDGDNLVTFCKQIAGLNLEERRKPQQGEVMAAIGDNKHKVFVKTDGSTAGEKLTLRIIYDEINYKVPDLGLNPKQLDAVVTIKEETNGLILLSAPRQNGLTTSIYSFTRTHDRFLQNVQTIEYEKELALDNVTQNIFVPGEGKTFAERLLKLVRADPDIIVLPELREREAAATAARAAAKKQKVYVGMIANDVFEALGKWIAAVGDRALVAKGLLAVGNQRLVRILCKECRQAYKPDPSMMRKLNLPADKVLYRPPEPEFDKHGKPIICQACQGTGYSGRTAIFDWLVVDDGLREVIRRSKAMSEIQGYLVKKGGLGLQNQALLKVLDGVTSIQEIARAVRGSRSGGGPRPKPKARPAAQPGKPRGGN